MDESRPAKGSSPLTRGKQIHAIRGRLGRGLIPAHAGKTWNTGIRIVPSWAHPRSRGENASASVVLISIMGSSPLTRGKRNGGPVGWVHAGLIPAHAGKTDTTFHVGGAVRAHPRSRGENGVPPQPGGQPPGSSPLTRGKLLHGAGHVVQAGLIPAHAGKTVKDRRCAGPAGAHPRSRGENAGGCGQRAGLLGSSPLTRGKLEVPTGPGGGEGLIPAHAGKTRCKSSKRTSATAHPRSRGENDQDQDSEEHVPGSSPLTRGKPRIEGTTST